MPSPLKLRAQTEDDLALMSGLLQDALIPGADMRYEATDRQFVAVLNRFCWERDGALDEKDETDANTGPYHRTHAALVMDGIGAIKSRGITLSDSRHLLNLLSVHMGDGEIELLFSGDVALRAECAEIRVRLQDLGEPWPTQWRPHHGHDAEILAEAQARLGAGDAKGAPNWDSGPARDDPAA